MKKKKLDKPWARFRKGKRVDSNKIRNERRDITMIPEKWKGSWEATVYNYTLTNCNYLKEIDKFLEMYNLLGLNHE